MTKRTAEEDILLTLRVHGYKAAQAIVLPTENAIVKCLERSYEPGWTEYQGDREIFIDNEFFTKLSNNERLSSEPTPILSFPFQKTAPDIFGHKIVKLFYRIETSSPNISIVALIRDGNDYWVGCIASPPFTIWTSFTNLLSSQHPPKGAL